MKSPDKDQFIWILTCLIGIWIFTWVLVMWVTQ